MIPYFYYSTLLHKSQERPAEFLLILECSMLVFTLFTNFVENICQVTNLHFTAWRGIMYVEVIYLGTQF